MDDLCVLNVLGTKSGMPGPRQPSSGYVLTVGDTTMLFDCGPGVAGALSTITTPDALDAVFISHLHADHCYDILPIAKAVIAPLVTYPQAGAVAELHTEPDRSPLYLPGGGTATMRRLQALFPVVSTPALDQAIELAFAIHEYQPREQVKIAGCLVTAFPVRHVVPTCGFRVESNTGTFAFTGDTGWTDELLDLARDADLLLAEATLRESDDGPHGHLSAREAGILANRAGAASLVLTHFSSVDEAWTDALRADAAAEFSGPVHIAIPGARFVAGATRRENTDDLR